MEIYHDTTGELLGTLPGSVPDRPEMIIREKLDPFDLEPPHSPWTGGFGRFALWDPLPGMSVLTKSLSTPGDGTIYERWVAGTVARGILRNVEGFEAASKESP